MHAQGSRYVENNVEEVQKKGLEKVQVLPETNSGRRNQEKNLCGKDQRTEAGKLKQQQHSISL